MADNNKLMVVDESTLKDKIYIIRGQQVMLILILLRFMDMRHDI